MVRLGELNVHGFGSMSGEGTVDVSFHHDATDDERVLSLLEITSVDLLALVGVVDVGRMESLVKRLTGTWRVRDSDGHAVCSDDPGQGRDDVPRVVLAWNTEVVELLRWARPIDGPGGRAPVVGRMRSWATRIEWTVVAIHAPSGAPRGWRDMPAGSREHTAGLGRTELLRRLASWLAGPRPGFDGPTIVVGDFGALAVSPETAALRALPGWVWPEPVVLPETADRSTSKKDAAIVDHFVLSPELAHEPPEILAFDRVEAIPSPPKQAPEVWKRTTDHRPIRISVAL